MRRNLISCVMAILLISGLFQIMGVASVLAGESVLSDCENASVWNYGASEGNSVKVSLDDGTSAKGKGKASVNIIFDLKPGKEENWMYCNIPVPKGKSNWTKFKDISFYLKGDGKDNAIRIGLMDSEGELFLSNETFDLSDTEWQQYIVALDEEEGFSACQYYQPHKDSIENAEILDLEGIKEFQIWIEDTYDKSRSGSFNIDYISLSSKEIL